jgi:hypothetical protein
MGAERAIILADEMLGNVAARQIQKMAGVRLSEEAGLLASRELLATRGAATAEDAAAKIMSVNKRAWLGGETEGNVFSNGDGTVTKVFHSLKHDAAATKSMYTELDQLGVKVPKTYEIGKTAEGNPALRMQQVGDGDNLQTQLLTGQIPRSQMPELLGQYDSMAKTIQGANIRIDWSLKNMTWHERNLYMLDPSFLKRGETLHPSFVEMFRPR